MSGESTATERVSASSAAININGFRVLEGAPLVGIITKPRAVVKTEMTRQQRDAIRALGRSVITIEQAFPREVADAPTLQERSPGRCLQMADAWSTHAAEFLRNVIESTLSVNVRRDAHHRGINEP